MSSPEVETGLGADRDMIDLYTWATPNGTKVALMLEECGLRYRVVPVDLARGEQRAADFLRINPNGRIPVIIDHDGAGGRPFALFESGAILLYLAEKTDRFLPRSQRERWLATQWVMFQMSAVGPMFGQLHHFKSSAPERHSYACARFENESRRLLGVLDAHLSKSEYFIGGDYGVADICTWPWLRSWQVTIKNDLDEFRHVGRWYQLIGARAAAVKAVSLYDELKAAAAPTSANADLLASGGRR